MTLRHVWTARITTAALALTLHSAPSLASTYTVDSTGDADDATPGDDTCATAGAVCTLRAAITEANAHSGTDTAVASSVSGTITLGSTLTVTEQLTLLGNASLGGTVVGGGLTSTWALTLDGGGTVQHGLTIASGAGGSSVRGFRFTGFILSGFGEAILIQSGANGCTITGNQFDHGNRGVVFASDNDQIGGTGSGDGNWCHDNDADDGVCISANGNASAFVIEGNEAGTNEAGTAAAPGHNGISIGDNASGGVVGGSTAASRNLLSGNVALGIHLDSATNIGNTIENNYIGVAINGTTPLCNAEGSIRDEGTATVILNNTEACRLIGCCAYLGHNQFGATCLDPLIIVFSSLPMTTCADADAFLATIRTCSGDNTTPCSSDGDCTGNGTCQTEVGVFNADANCSPTAGDPSGTCAAAGSTPSGLSFTSLVLQPMKLTPLKLTPLAP